MSGRVQFPSQLLGPDPPRQQSRNVGTSKSSGNQNPRSASTSNDPTSRTRTRSTDSQTRPETPNTRYKTISPSPLNPARKRSTSQHTRHRSSDKHNDLDPSHYDDLHGFLHPNLEQDETSGYGVSAEHLEDISRVMQRRKKLAQTERALRRVEAAHAAMGQPLPPELQPTEQTPSPILPPRTHSMTTMSPLSLQGQLSPPREPSSEASATLNSETTDATEALRLTDSKSPKDKEPSPDSWKAVLKRTSGKGKARPVMTEEQYRALEVETEARIQSSKEHASLGSRERAATTKNQLERQYAILLPTLIPGKRPFNLMDVVRWRRTIFDDTTQRLDSNHDISPEDKSERDILSWRPHLADLHDMSNSRYRSRIHAPWHLTASLMEQYQHSQSLSAPVPPPLRRQSSQRFSDSSPGPSDSEGAVLKFSPSKSGGTNPYPLNETNRNRSSFEVPKSFESLRRLRRSRPDSNAPEQSSERKFLHQSLSSLSGFPFLGSGSPAANSPTSSRRHVNLLGRGINDGFSMARETSDSEEGRLLKPQGKDGSVEVLSPLSLPVSPQSDHAASQRLNLEDDVHFSSDSAHQEKRRRHWSYSPRRTAKTTPPVVDVTPAQKMYSDELDLISHGPQLARRFRHSAPPMPRNSIIEVNLDEKQAHEQEAALDDIYDNRERNIEILAKMELDLQSSMNGVGNVIREYNRLATRIKSYFALNDLEVIPDQWIRLMTGVLSTAHDRDEADHIFEQITAGNFTLPVDSPAYFDHEDLQESNDIVEELLNDIRWTADTADEHRRKQKAISAELAQLDVRSRTGKGVELARHIALVETAITNLSRLVNSSRPVPTWQRIMWTSDRVLASLTWVLDRALAILRAIAAVIANASDVSKFIVSRFGPPGFARWEESLSRFLWSLVTYQRVMFLLHFFPLMGMRWWRDTLWEFERSYKGWIAWFVMGWGFYYVYWWLHAYVWLVRHFVFSDWWEVPRSEEAMSGGAWYQMAILRLEWWSLHWQALSLLCGGAIAVLWLLYFWNLF